MRRVSPAFLTVAMLGVVGLLVVMYIGKKLLAREAPAPVDTTISVPMALNDLEPGTRITEAHLAVARTDRAKISRETVLSNRVLVGRVVKNKISVAQPISTSDLYPPGENEPLALSTDAEAVTLSVPAPFVARKGQYINIHFIPNNDPDSERTGGQIYTLFRGVKVLRADVSNSNRGNVNVVLELPRGQSKFLLLARDNGTLNFTYAPEGPGDGQLGVNDQERATLYEILNYKAPEDTETPPFHTDVFSGSGRSVNSFIDGRFANDSAGWNGSNSGFGNGGARTPPLLRGGGYNRGATQSPETGGQPRSANVPGRQPNG